MIHDAQDGTTGRRVWRIALPEPVYVIARDAHAARAWIRTVTDDLPPGPLVVTDAGSADRTEIGVWRDESYLDANPPTDPPPEGGA